MFSGSFAGSSSSSALGVLRNDVSQPNSLGFMKPIKDETVAKQSEISTIVNDNLEVLETIPLPMNLGLKEIRKVMETKIAKDIKKDPLHKVASDLSNYANNFYEKMEKYFDGIFEFDAELKKRKHYTVFSLSKDYLMSDLPSSYIQILSSSFLTETKFLTLYDDTIRRERLHLRVVRYDNRKFKRICDNHNNWVDKLKLLHESMLDSRIKLLWYVDFHNCDTADEVFELKELKKSRIDMETFFGYVIELQKKTDHFRKSIIDLNRKLFEVSYNRDDSTVNLLCNSVELLNGSS